jgi:hypothetical protein
MGHGFREAWNVEGQAISLAVVAMCNLGLDTLMHQTALPTEVKHLSSAGQGTAL